MQGFSSKGMNHLYSQSTEQVSTRATHEPCWLMFSISVGCFFLFPRILCVMLSLLLFRLFISPSLYTTVGMVSRNAG